MAPVAPVPWVPGVANPFQLAFHILFGLVWALVERYTSLPCSTASSIAEAVQESNAAR